MKKGDLLIWDSGFGVDICVFKKIPEWKDDYAIVDVLTGNFTGRENGYPLHELHPYSKELLSEIAMNRQWYKIPYFNENEYRKKIRQMKLKELNK